MLPDLDNQFIARIDGEMVTAAHSPIKGTSTDTRTLQPGDIFFALSGETYDGNAFAGEAIAKGASWLILSAAVADLPGMQTLEADARRVGAGLIVVNSPLEAYQSYATCHRANFDIPVVAVTGSSGKTTTKDMVHAVMGTRFNTLKTEGTFNNEIGLPKTLLKLRDSHQAAVLEMGMRGIGQIRHLCEIARPTMGIVTNVGPAHVELLGSVEEVARAKAELVESIPKDGFVILNHDQDIVAQMRGRTPASAVTYGFHEGADVRASNIRLAEWKGSREFWTRFSIHTARGQYEAELPLPGKHNIMNALAAWAVGEILDVPPSEMAEAFRDMRITGMRHDAFVVGDVYVIDDTYNANPLSVHAALDTLENIASGTAVAILGDMLELGHLAKTAHHEVGSRAGKFVDRLIAIGQWAEVIADGARQAGLPDSRIMTMSDAHIFEQHIDGWIFPGDTVLVKASRGLKLERIVALLKQTFHQT